MKQHEFSELPEKDRANRVLEGIAYFASVHEPNLAAQRLFGEAPCFKVNLGLDSQEEIDKALSFGLKVRQPKDNIPLPFVVLKTKIKEGKTADDVRPDVVDSMQKEIPSSILIGNGSRLKAKFMTYWHRTADQHGAGTYMTKVQVLNLVKYVPKQEDDFVTNESGFKVEDFDSLADDLPFDPPTTPAKTKGSSAATTGAKQPQTTDLDKLFDE